MSHRIVSQIAILPKGLRTRFAPSPTGYLHLGHVASAIYVWGLGRKLGAQIVLRMEDHDRQRSRKHYETSIIEDLLWLGFEWDEGVRSADETSVFRQSDHNERYSDALQVLGKKTYQCICSRKDIQERTGTHPDELWYDGWCRDRNAGPNTRVSLSPEVQTFDDLLLGAQSQIPAKQCGDLLLRDRAGQWTYNFAVVVDDIAEDINLIIRGQDILAATGRQLQLRHLLGNEEKPYLLHHPLIWADEAHKLSKRDHATSIAQWRAEGHKAADLIGKAAYQVGLISKEHPIAAKDLEGLFS